MTSTYAGCGRFLTSGKSFKVTELQYKYTKCNAPNDKAATIAITIAMANLGKSSPIFQTPADQLLLKSLAALSLLIPAWRANV